MFRDLVWKNRSHPLKCLCALLGGEECSICGTQRILAQEKGLLQYHWTKWSWPLFTVLIVLTVSFIQQAATMSRLQCRQLLDEAAWLLNISSKELCQVVCRNVWLFFACFYLFVCNFLFGAGFFVTSFLAYGLSVCGCLTTHHIQLL